MSLTLSTFQVYPTSSLTDSPALTLRLWYSQQFLDVDGNTVMAGPQDFCITFDCSVASGVITVSSNDIFTTLDAQVPYPQAIQVSARFYSGNTAKDYLFQNWFIPAEASYPGGAITFEQLTIENQATVLVNPPQVYWTSSQVEAYFNTLTTNNNASSTVKGITKLDVDPASATNPIAVGVNSPLLQQSPLTTKGDIYSYSTTNARFPVGTNGKVLTADSTQTLGLKYKFGPAGTTFNIKDYGAVGDNSTDNTTALNGAIDACNTAGGGRFYIPTGKFRTSSGALHAFTVPVLMYGDGGGKYESGATSVAGALSQIITTSTTGNLFTFGDTSGFVAGSGGSTIQDIAFVNAASSTPASGCALYFNGYGGWFAHIERNTFEAFYDNVVFHDGDSPTITENFFSDPVHYGLYLRNVISPDSGDQGVIDNTFIAYNNTSTAAVQYESGGGLRFIGNKINTHNGTGKFTVGLNATFGSGIHTADLVVTGNSFENTVNEGIKIVTTSDGTFKQILINGNQLAPTNTTAPAITIAAGTYPNISRIGIGGGNVFSGGDAAYPAIQLTNVDGAKVPFNANYYTGYGGLLKSLTSTDVDILYIYTKSDQSGCVIDPYNYQTATRKGMEVYGNPLVHYDNGVAFASLPTVPASTYAYTVVTDSTTTTWGATITGGGSSKVLAFWNGTNWKVAGA